jgi:uncharacterized protein
MSETVDMVVDAVTIHSLIVSDWTIAEFHCALARKVRSKALSVSDADKVAKAFLLQVVKRLPPVRVTRGDFRRISDDVNRMSLPLRAGDALHLAIACRTATRFITLDRDQAQAASTLGLDVVVPGDPQSTSSTAPGPPP